MFIAGRIIIPTSSFEDMDNYTWLEGVYIDTIVMDFYLAKFK